MNYVSKNTDRVVLNSEPFDDQTMAQLRVARAIKHLRAGRGVIVTDDADRENEGDFIFAAEHLTVEQMALMIREGSGIVCLVMTKALADQLELPPMVEKNGSKYGTGFTVSIEASVGISSGVSAMDRTTTVRAAVAHGAQATDLVRPGHIFPLRCHPDGLHGRKGHTEATIQLMRLAGLREVGVLCEVTNPDGTMAVGNDLVRSAEQNGLAMLSIADLMSALTERTTG
jgi:3,4-dihydroxy 2-butanone 4-phosphate synthase